jgi:hypothetical protein
MARDLTDRSAAPQSYEAQQSYDDSGYNRDRDFWPADVPAGVVDGAVGVAGAAVGTAGAIATAPFRDSYAYGGYDNGPYASGPSGDYHYSQSYAQRNGFVCQPGTIFRGEDGRGHICQ